MILAAEIAGHELLVEYSLAVSGGDTSESMSTTLVVLVPPLSVVVNTTEPHQ